MAGKSHAEVRALYFAALAKRYTRYKQAISGLSLFLSSGAAATIAASSPQWLPLILATVAAVINAYAIAAGIDRRASTMVKLYSTWHQIEADYDFLWNRWYEDVSADRYARLVHRAKEASELGITEAPLDLGLLEKWRVQVYSQYETAGG